MKHALFVLVLVTGLAGWIRPLRGANHSLVRTRQGLNEEIPRADRFAEGFLTTVRDWLRARAILR